MNINFFIIEALTNMHVGSGDSNYGVIDNLVQRDSITSMPTIYGSSLKGSLREHFESKWDEKDTKIISIFGSDPKEKEKNSPANYRFFSAQLLAFPVRSNKKPYFMATAPMLINQLNDTLETLGFEKDKNLDGLIKNYHPNTNRPIVFKNNQEDLANLVIEDFENFCIIQADINPFANILGVKENNLAIFHDEDFKKICGENCLPVIARNQLEDGTSKNLWYEEIVPRETRFWTYIIHPDEYYKNFELVIENDIIQIGANATIGYGFTKFRKLEVKNAKES